jgi:hypothetical protein
MRGVIPPLPHTSARRQGTGATLPLLNYAYSCTQVHILLKIFHLGPKKSVNSRYVKFQDISNREKGGNSERNWDDDDDDKHSIFSNRKANTTYFKN